MSILLLLISLGVVVGLYYVNNPLKHGGWFMFRRLVNWFPLGMTYAFLYMGRYNLNVSKNAMGSAMSKEEFGLIFAAGTITYALSFLLNGPLVDKIGGKKGIIIAALGSSVCNILLGVATYLMMTGKMQMHIVGVFSVLYAMNMFFQSYGAVSIIKVKAYWFHVRERGVFGATFGTLISLGVYFAFDWGTAIANMAKVNPEGRITWLHSVIQKVFAVEAKPVDATWAVFFIPAAILLAWALIDWLLIKDTPEECDFPPFDTHDASSGEMDKEFTAGDLLRRVFTSPLMLFIAAVELTSGVLRNGVMQWYFIFAKEVKQPGAEFFLHNWGLLLCIFGIIGGFAGGLISDRFFQSRRGPPAALLCGFMLVMTIVMAVFLKSSPFVVGAAAVLISMAVIGVHSLMSGTAAADFGGRKATAVHSLMSGTAAADFGGRKATATCSGIVDGFVYLGSGIQSISIGYLTERGDWIWWPIFLAPFALIGLILALKIWNDLPPATKRYIEEVERKSQAQTELAAKV